MSQTQTKCKIKFLTYTYQTQRNVLIHYIAVNKGEGVSYCRSSKFVPQHYVKISKLVELFEIRGFLQVLRSPFMIVSVLGCKSNFHLPIVSKMLTLTLRRK